MTDKLKDLIEKESDKELMSYSHAYVIEAKDEIKKLIYQIAQKWGEMRVREYNRRSVALINTGVFTKKGAKKILKSL